MTTVRVPASSANLGPGFDALGMALELYLVCRFEPAAALSIRVSGRDAACIPTSEDNLIWQTALNVARDVGETLPAVTLHIENDIPIGKGLGSAPPLSPPASLLPTISLACTGNPCAFSTRPRASKAIPIMSPPASSAPSLPARSIPAESPAPFASSSPRATASASSSPISFSPPPKLAPYSPLRYSREDTVFNVQRSALLIAALTTGTTSAFPAALEDRLHQPYRAALVPGLDEIVRLRAPGLLGCVLSGAGPSVLVFYEKGCEQVCDLVRQIFAYHGHQSVFLWAHIADHGYEISG